ncbi:MAG: energy-coupled thiamine transporter ThiT [Streptococcaceae bacterium]|jgi:thiamine transporter|nr:energy-coupled thiamine transporter ThiT [Streptococcaceae bacterium]
MSRFPLRELTEIALMTALATVFDHLKLFDMPQGGSVTLVMLPIIFIGLRRGLRAGLLTGLFVGLIQLIFGGFFLNPLQVLLDYILAMLSVGVAGFWRGKSTLSALTVAVFAASALRLLSNFLSGVIYYGSYAPKGTPVWLYSLIYNASYIVPAGILSAVVLVILSAVSPRLFHINHI